ncbi:MAG: hypothetical protein M1828_005513 [Chrysothrix sp. TS-e1954]|nr:MAG: hypothetical protein M1828_005513 [Chrysothrix sp. TS-e1954]
MSSQQRSQPGPVSDKNASGRGFDQPIRASSSKQQGSSSAVPTKAMLRVPTNNRAKSLEDNIDILEKEKAGKVHLAEAYIQLKSQVNDLNYKESFGFMQKYGDGKIGTLHNISLIALKKVKEGDMAHQKATGKAGRLHLNTSMYPDAPKRKLPSYYHED